MPTTLKKQNEPGSGVSIWYMQQVSCEKHEYVIVTQTTTVNIGGVEHLQSKRNWLQCKNCSKTVAFGGQETKK